jgi:BASS family bile acid:Na+ symporter
VTPDQLVEAIAKVSGLLFVVTSMLAMGLSLTIAQILQPLKNVRLVILALVANFALAPLLGYGIARLISLDQPLKTGLIVLATAAGAPFLPKLVQGAKGNVAFGVGLMVLLMVVTIPYLPIVLPLLLPDVKVDPWDIAKSLIVLMLVPLAIGLLIKWHSPDTAAHWQPVMAKTSSIALLILLVVGLGLNVSNIINLIGTGGIAAALLFIVGSLAVGFVLGGRDPGVRNVMALGTAQRNVSAALVVTAQNFSSGTTLPFVLVTAILGLLILLPAARLLGRRGQAAKPQTAEPPSTAST